MLKTRFTPAGKRKKRTPTWQQITAMALGAAMALAFLTLGLPYMSIGDVVQAHPASPTPSATPAAPTPTPDATQEASDAPETPASPTPVPTPFQTILTEDSEAGIWAYEDASVRIDIERQQPLEGVVATVAVITAKTDQPVVHTAFAEGMFSQNVRARTRDIAASVDAIFAINGDYCGYRSNGVIVREGTLYRDNPTRDAMCLFADGSLRVMDEDEMDAEALIEQGLTDSWSFGPVLVRDGVLPDSFDTDVTPANPRTAFGQRADGSYVAVVVDGRLSGYSDGMTIEELAQYMLDLGCVNAYNLDGGMTSCMYFNGNVISTPCGTANKERTVSDILYIAKQAE